MQSLWIAGAILSIDRPVSGFRRRGPGRLIFLGWRKHSFLNLILNSACRVWTPIDSDTVNSINRVCNNNMIGKIGGRAKILASGLQSRHSAPKPKYLDVKSKTEDRSIENKIDHQLLASPTVPHAPTSGCKVVQTKSFKHSFRTGEIWSLNIF